MADDITNDLALLDDWLAGKGYGEEAGLCMRAMDLIRKQAGEIEKLRKQNEFIMSANNELSWVFKERDEALAQVEKLRAILAELADEYEQFAYEGAEVALLKEARAALGESDE